jgi:1,4-dihydroxy-2-naphthoate polyprenyltransferase
MEKGVKLYQLEKIFDAKTIAHLRIPFSFYLLPIFCFSLCFTNNGNWSNAIIIFLCLHFFIYPGSNIYNSYMDKDEGPIGGLKNPPPASIKLYFASIICDFLGLLLATLVSPAFAIALLFYILVSKAYSWHFIRLKKYPLISWFVVMLTQGGYTFFLVTYFAANTNSSWISIYNLIGFIIVSLFVGAYYPLTQVYQHQEDSKRGDLTLSKKLSFKGTFLFSFILLFIANLLLMVFFIQYLSVQYLILYSAMIYPVAMYFLKWFYEVTQDSSHASYERTMTMNFISSLCMSTAFILITFLNVNNLKPFDWFMK